jgi:hypothetical protein
VSFDDHASSVIHVPHTRAEQISILRRHLRSTWFRPSSLPPSPLIALRVSRDSAKFLSHGKRGAAS